MSVTVNSVTKNYGSQKALDGVSFEARPGEVLGFLGPNGAGKSTMMKIITCFLPQSSGEVKVCGFDVGEDPIEVKKRVGYLPEHNPLYTDMYVKEYLGFIAGLHRISGNRSGRVQEMIALTGLEREQHKKIGALSKGYRQRVGLAQSLIHDPQVLILDEPTSGLDPNQLVGIRELISSIGKERTVIFSTHIMQEVEAICSRVIIINQGKIVADEATEVLKETGSSRTVISLELDKEADAGMIAKVPGVQAVSPAGERKWKITAIPGQDIRPGLFRFAVENGLAVLSMNAGEQKLEDVFRSLTSQS